jgi:Zn-dependent protease
MSSPLRKFCAHCGMEIPLDSDPIFCPHCGFRISDRMIPPPTTASNWGNNAEYPRNESSGYTARNSQPLSFSRTEVRDILIAWISLAIAFTVAITGGLFDTFSSRLEMTVNGVPEYLGLEETFLVALVTIGVGFVLHEMMHKFVAERYGFQAGFRMWLQGLGLALFSAFAFGIVFAAPGATYFMGSGVSKKENGIISLAGPLTNVAIALLFLPLLLVNTNNLLILEAGYLGCYFNFFLATFNMLPIFVLDGAKVWRWNKLYWAAVFIPVALVVVGFIIGYI